MYCTFKSILPCIFSEITIACWKRAVLYTVHRLVFSVQCCADLLQYVYMWVYFLNELESVVSFVSLCPFFLILSSHYELFHAIVFLVLPSRLLLLWTPEIEGSARTEPERDTLIRNLGDRKRQSYLGRPLSVCGSLPVYCLPRKKFSFSREIYFANGRDDKVASIISDSIFIRTRSVCSVDNKRLWFYFDVYSPLREITLEFYNTMITYIIPINILY